MLKVLTPLFLILLFACQGDKEEPENVREEISISRISTYDVISYLNAHNPIDTAVIKIPDDYTTLIAVKKQEKQLFDDWITQYRDKPHEGILEIWQKFGAFMDVITLEFKIIEYRDLNPRIIFLKKERFYRHLDLPFIPFGNAQSFEMIQNQLLFAMDLISTYDRQQIEDKLEVFFKQHPEISASDSRYMSFDLLRWYQLQEEGLIKPNSKPKPGNEKPDTLN